MKRKYILLTLLLTSSAFASGSVPNDTSPAGGVAPKNAVTAVKPGAVVAGAKKEFVLKTTSGKFEERGFFAKLKEFFADLWSIIRFKGSVYGVLGNPLNTDAAKPELMIEKAKKLASTGVEAHMKMAAQLFQKAEEGGKSEDVKKALESLKDVVLVDAAKSSATPVSTAANSAPVAPGADAAGAAPGAGAVAPVAPGADAAGDNQAAVESEESDAETEGMEESSEAKFKTWVEGCRSLFAGITPAFLTEFEAHVQNLPTGSPEEMATKKAMESVLDTLKKKQPRLDVKNLTFLEASEDMQKAYDNMLKYMDAHQKKAKADRELDGFQAATTGAVALAGAEEAAVAAVAAVQVARRLTLDAAPDATFNAPIAAVKALQDYAKVDYLVDLVNAFEAFAANNNSQDLLNEATAALQVAVRKSAEKVSAVHADVAKKREEVKALERDLESATKEYIKSQEQLLSIMFGGDVFTQSERANVLYLLNWRLVNPAFGGVPQGLLSAKGASADELKVRFEAAYDESNGIYNAIEDLDKKEGQSLFALGMLYRLTHATDKFEGMNSLLPHALHGEIVSRLTKESPASDLFGVAVAHSDFVLNNIDLLRDASNRDIATAFHNARAAAQPAITAIIEKHPELSVAKASDAAALVALFAKNPELASAASFALGHPDAAALRSAVKEIESKVFEACEEEAELLTKDGSLTETQKNVITRALSSAKLASTEQLKLQAKRALATAVHTALGQKKDAELLSLIRSNPTFCNAIDVLITPLSDSGKKAAKEAVESATKLTCGANDSVSVVALKRMVAAVKSVRAIVLLSAAYDAAAAAAQATPGDAHLAGAAATALTALNTAGTAAEVLNLASTAGTGAFVVINVANTPSADNAAAITAAAASTSAAHAANAIVTAARGSQTVKDVAQEASLLPGATKDTVVAAATAAAILEAKVLVAAHANLVNGIDYDAVKAIDDNANKLMSDFIDKLTGKVGSDRSQFMASRDTAEKAFEAQKTVVDRLRDQVASIRILLEQLPKIVNAEESKSQVAKIRNGSMIPNKGTHILIDTLDYAAIVGLSDGDWAALKVDAYAKNPKNVKEDVACACLYAMQEVITRKSVKSGAYSSSSLSHVKECVLATAIFVKVLKKISDDSQDSTLKARIKSSVDTACQFANRWVKDEHKLSLEHTPDFSRGKNAKDTKIDDSMFLEGTSLEVEHKKLSAERLEFEAAKAKEAKAAKAAKANK